MRLRRGAEYDVDFEDVFAKPIIVVVIAVVVYLFSLLLAGATISESIETDRIQNEHAAIFNQLDEETRDQLLPMLKYDIEEGNTIPTKNVDDPMTIGEFAKGFGIFILAAAYIVCSCFAMYGYWSEKNRYYFIVDFPHEPLGIFIAILTLPFIPFYLISALHMLIWYLRGSKAESKEVERAAIEDIRYEKTHKPLSGPMAQRAKGLYIQYITTDRIASHDAERDSIAARIEQLKAENTEYRNGFQRTRKELTEAQTALENLRLESTTENALRAEQEWEQIRQMRGVYSLSTQKAGPGKGKRDSKGRKLQKLLIGVRVRVEYDGELYDFGDYRIEIEGTNFRAIRTRSGVRMNATDRSPDYNESGGFCFGSRRYEIAEYIQKGRLLEAITLMIDSLHSVNSEEVEAAIPKCFRRVKTIEKAKRRLLRKKEEKKK